HGQHQVGGRGALAQLAAQLEAHDVGNDHRQRLAEHGGFGSDAAHAAAEHAQPIDHGGVAVGADQRVGIGEGLLALLFGPHDLRQVFEVDLVADAGARWHDAEIVEVHLAPAQELVALEIALVLELDVGLEGAGVAEVVDDHRMVDHEIDRHRGFDLLGAPPPRPHGVAHGGEIDHPGHAGEVLHQDSGGAEVDLLGRFAAVAEPLGEGGDVLPLDGGAVLVTDQVFQQDAQGRGQAAEIADLLLDSLEAVISVAATADLHRLAGLEAVGMGGGGHFRHSWTVCSRDSWQNRGMAAARQSADASVPSMCQIVRMWWNTARFVAAFAALVIASAEAYAQRNAVESWDPSARDFGRSMIQPGALGATPDRPHAALDNSPPSCRVEA